MVNHIVDTSRPRGRVEIQVGVGRRRRWSAAVKGRIVGESFETGAVVSEVARRHGISPQHLFAWRKAARAGLRNLQADEAPLFIPVVTPGPDGAAATGVNGSGGITIEIGSVVVRASRGVDPMWLRDVLRAVKAAT
jgi:transposase